MCGGAVGFNIEEIQVLLCFRGISEEHTPLTVVVSHNKAEAAVINTAVKRRTEMNRIKGSAMIFQINAEGEIIKTLIFIICIYLLPISAQIVTVPAFLFHTVDCAVFKLYIS